MRAIEQSVGAVDELPTPGPIPTVLQEPFLRSTHFFILLPRPVYREQHRSFCGEVRSSTKQTTTTDGRRCSWHACGRRVVSVEATVKTFDVLRETATSDNGGAPGNNKRGSRSNHADRIALLVVRQTKQSALVLVLLVRAPLGRGWRRRSWLVTCVGNKGDSAALKATATVNKQ